MQFKYNEQIGHNGCIVERALENGRLEQLFSEFTTDEFGLYALYLFNRHLTSRVRALIDHLAAHLQREEPTAQALNA